MEAWHVASGLVALYLLLSLAIGVLAQRRMKVDVEDFLLYGRRAGFVVLYLTVVASFHSTFALLGAAGYFYTHGIGFFVAGCWTVLSGAVTWLLGTRVWALGKRFGYITPPEMLGALYGSAAIRILAALVSVVFTLTYIQGQTLGMGYVLRIATGEKLSLEVSMAILIGVAGIYLIAGGLRAVYWTDVLQGIWMFAAIWVAALYLVHVRFGSVPALFDRLASERAELLTLPGPRGLLTPQMWISFTILFSFGVLLQPHMWMRWFSSASEGTLRWLGATTPIYLMSIFIPAALIGLAGALTVELEGTGPDTVFPRMLFDHAPAWLTGLVLAGIVAAGMSTLDSILHANMTILVRDLYARYIRRDASPARQILVGRLFAVGLMGVGFLLSVVRSDFLVQLVALSAAGTLQLLPALVGALFPSRVRFTTPGVLAGLVAALATLSLLFFVPGVPTSNPLGLHGGVWALLVNFALAFAVARGARGAVSRKPGQGHGHGHVHGWDKREPGSRPLR